MIMTMTTTWRTMKAMGTQRGTRRPWPQAARGLLTSVMWRSPSSSSSSSPWLEQQDGHLKIWNQHIKKKCNINININNISINSYIIKRREGQHRKVDKMGEAWLFFWRIETKVLRRGSFKGGFHQWREGRVTFQGFNRKVKFLSGYKKKYFSQASRCWMASVLFCFLPWFSVEKKEPKHSTKS